MKKHLIIIIGIFCLISFSCKKSSFNYPEGTVGISKITEYPIITINGEPFTAVAKGSAFTDPGAIAKAGEETITLKTSGQVNASVAGVYSIIYSAVNKDGYSASATRRVLIYDTKADAAGNDFSGTYKRVGFDTKAVWKKLAPGAYLVSNPGGAANADGILVFAINPTGTSVSLPKQDSDSGSWSSSVANYSKSTGTYAWTVANAGYGPALRTFVKQ